MAYSAPLQASRGRGPLVGFGNMADKEYGRWWRTRRWLLHVMLWLVVVNGLIFLVGMGDQGENPYELLDELIQIFFLAGGLFAAIGIVVSTQSAILGERERGTAEWVLSKPITREAFVLAKLLLNGASFLFLAVAIPTTVLFSQTLLHTYLQPDLGPFLLGLGLHVEHLLFYLALCLALGTFFASRGAVSGLALGFAFAGLILPNFAPWLMPGTPWPLLQLAARAGTGQPLGDGAWQPILVTALWIAFLILVALWRFDREEF